MTEIVTNDKESENGGYDKKDRGGDEKEGDSDKIEMTSEGNDEELDGVFDKTTDKDDEDEDIAEEDDGHKAAVHQPNMQEELELLERLLSKYDIKR